MSFETTGNLRGSYFGYAGRSRSCLSNDESINNVYQRRPTTSNELFKTGYRK
jgi:hypothetical protein